MSTKSNTDRGFHLMSKFGAMADIWQHLRSSGVLACATIVIFRQYRFISELPCVSSTRLVVAATPIKSRNYTLGSTLLLVLGIASTES